jgi:protein-tyrosine-phosphatase
VAEAMARKYGSDVLSAASAGVSPAVSGSPTTRTMLSEINIETRDHPPRRLLDVNLGRFDLIVNMSGAPLPANTEVPVEDWEIDDPYGRPPDDFRRVRGEIEMRVMDLILRARLGKLRPLGKYAGSTTQK